MYFKWRNFTPGEIRLRMQVNKLVRKALGLHRVMLGAAILIPQGN